MCVNYRNQISKVVYIKKSTCSAPSTWVSKRHWMSQSEPVNLRPPLPLSPLPFTPPPRPPLSGKCGVFGQRYRRFWPRPKSPADENSSGRNLRTKTLQAEASEKCSSFYAHPPLLPSLSNKAGWAFTVNCSGILLDTL